MFLIKYPDSYGLFLTIFYKNTKRGTAMPRLNLKVVGNPYIQM